MKISKLMNGIDILKSIFKIRFLGKRIPVYCEWEITNYCNMTCAWCSTLTPARNSAADLSTEESIDIIDQLGKLGTRAIHFSGGEPTLRKDLPELITRAKQNKMMVSFTTNGSASFSILDELLHANMIRVSIDGTEKFHDEQRGYHGAFAKAIKTLEYLKSKEHNPMLVSFYTDESSFPMLTELAQFSKELDIKMILNIHIFHGEHGEKVKSFYGWKENKIDVMYLSALDRLKKEFGDTMANAEPFSSVVKLGGLNNYGCRAMDIAINIKGDGSVCLPCTQFPQKIEKGNLKKVFYGTEAEKIRSTQGKAPSCEGCLMRCMSSASAMLNTKGQVSLFKTYAKNFLFS